MSSTATATLSIAVDFAQQIDLQASLAPLGRWGDDLLDRWDGEILVRTARVPAHGPVIAYAARPRGSPDAARLEVHVPAQAAAHIEEVAGHVRQTLLADQAALSELAAVDQGVGRLRGLYPGVVPVLFADPLAALIRSISAQQVNLRWAAVVRRRLAERYGSRRVVGPWRAWSLEADALASARIADLRTSIQLTTAKSLAVIECARAQQAGELEIGALRALDDDQLIAHLTRLRGIGHWSAEWFLARTLGRPRVVAGDLGVRKAIGRLYATDDLPTEKEVRRLTSHWEAAGTHAQALALHDLAVAASGS